MTVLKWQNDDKLMPRFNSIFNDFFADNYLDKVSLGTTIPAVNIKETEQAFALSFAAPGLSKEDFKINLDHQRLTISSEKKSEKENSEEGKFTRREYSYSSFARSFNLPETIDVEKIEANYNNGELTILLPKKEKATKLTKEIAIS